MRATKKYVETVEKESRRNRSGRIEERKNVSNRWKDWGKVEREQSDSFAKR